MAAPLLQERFADHESGLLRLRARRKTLNQLLERSGRIGGAIKFQQRVPILEQRLRRVGVRRKILENRLIFKRGIHEIPQPEITRGRLVLRGWPIFALRITR